jgi:hypothetical protein
MRRILWDHEEMIQGTKSSIWYITIKVHENEQQVVSQVASIMGMLA